MTGASAAWPAERQGLLQAESHFGGRVFSCYRDRPGSLWDLFAASVARSPAAEAIIAGDRRLSYAELERLVGVAAANLRARGLAPGDRLALLLGNGAEFAILVL